jgi:hypothetical protein
MYETSPWQIAVGIAVVKMKNHASNVALQIEKRKGKCRKSFHFISLQKQFSTSLRFTYIKAFLSVLIDMLEMGCTTAKNRSSDIRTNV